MCFFLQMNGWNGQLSCSFWATLTAVLIHPSTFAIFFFIRHDMMSSDRICHQTRYDTNISQTLRPTSARWLLPPSLRTAKHRSPKSQLFSVLAPQWKNELPAGVRTAESLTSFLKRDPPVQSSPGLCITTPPHLPSPNPSTNFRVCTSCHY